MATNQAYISSLATSHRARAHNRKGLPSICVISGVQIYVVPELSTDNERWINPDFGTPRTADSLLATISSGWSRKDRTCHAGKGKGNARERMERLSRWQDVHPSVKEYCLSDRTPHWLMYAKFGEECQRRWGITPLQIFLHKDEGIGWTVSRKRKTRSASSPVTDGSKPNYHAHIVFDWMNHETRKSRKLNDEDMATMQTHLRGCDILLMERGQAKAVTGKNIGTERFYHWETESRTATYETKRHKEQQVNLISRTQTGKSRDALPDKLKVQLPM